MKYFNIIQLFILLLSFSFTKAQENDIEIAKYNADTSYCIGEEGAVKFIKVILFEKSKKFSYFLQFFSVAVGSLEIKYVGDFLRNNDTLILKNAKSSSFVYYNKNGTKDVDSKIINKTQMIKWIKAEIIDEKEKKYIVTKDKLVLINRDIQTIILKREIKQNN